MDYDLYREAFFNRLTGEDEVTNFLRGGKYG